MAVSPVLPQPGTLLSQVLLGTLPHFSGVAPKCHLLQEAISSPLIQRQAALSKADPFPALALVLEPGSLLGKSFLASLHFVFIKISARAGRNVQGWLLTYSQGLEVH